MKTIIERNTPLPVRKQYGLTTTRDGQTDFELVVLQGESTSATASASTSGTVRLTGLPAGPRGMVKIAVSFELGAECLLTVTARELNSGRKVQVVMSAKEGSTAARRKLDDGLSKGATGVWPVATTPPAASPPRATRPSGPAPSAASSAGSWAAARCARRAPSALAPVPRAGELGPRAVQVLWRRRRLGRRLAAASPRLQPAQGQHHDHHRDGPEDVAAEALRLVGGGLDVRAEVEAQADPERRRDERGQRRRRAGTPSRGGARDRR